MSLGFAALASAATLAAVLLVCWCRRRRRRSRSGAGTKPPVATGTAGLGQRSPRAGGNDVEQQLKHQTGCPFATGHVPSTSHADGAEPVTDPTSADLRNNEARLKHATGCPFATDRLNGGTRDRIAHALRHATGCPFASTRLLRSESAPGVSGALTGGAAGRTATTDAMNSYSEVGASASGSTGATNTTGSHPFLGHHSRVRRSCTFVAPDRIAEHLSAEAESLDRSAALPRVDAVAARAHRAHSARAHAYALSATFSGAGGASSSWTTASCSIGDCSEASEDSSTGSRRSARHRLIAALAQIAAAKPQQLFVDRYVLTAERRTGGQSMVSFARSTSGLEQFAIKYVSTFCHALRDRVSVRHSTC